MKHFIKIFLVTFLISKGTLSQNIQYSYTNYTIKDGLAGNNVYCSVQDKEGFIWFGTETGLSRFDGTHFKNYSIKDGLPDNEIIDMFCDSKGRVWFAPFKKSVCYYFKGKIYNQQNNELLKSINLKYSVTGFCEDNEGNIYFNQRHILSIITKNNKIINYDSILNQKLSQINKIEKNIKGGINIINDNQFIHFNGTFISNIILKQRGAIQNSYALSKKYLVVDNDNPKTESAFKYVFNLQNNNWDSIKSDHKFISHNIINDTLLTVNTSKGCIMYSLSNLKNSSDTFLKSISIGRVYKDTEDEFWFLSRNHGIYKMASKLMYNFKNNVSSNNTDINFIKKIGSKIVIANSESEIYETNNNFITYQTNQVLNKSSFFSKLVDIINLKNKNKIYCTSYGLFDKTYPYFLGSIKEINIVNDSILLAVTSNSTFYFNYSNLFEKNIKTIWSERATSALYDVDSVFIGSLNGLFIVKNNKSSYGLSTIDKIFERRISSIKKGPDGTIWVGTYDAGVVAYKNGKVLQVFNDSIGLTSNICRNLFINGNYLWVGTDKGLNKIDITKPPYKIVITYTTTDGLASNMINAIFTDSNMVYVGTPEGLTFFDETKIVNDSKCNMRILGITISGKEQQWDSSKIVLKNVDNNIRFDFVGLSYKSAGDIMYSYRLIGLDVSEWKTTRENYLEYPTLPSGNYSFEIFATNKFGVKSEIVKIDIEIEKKLAEKLWFRILLLCSIVGLIYFFINRRINKIKSHEEEKQIIANKLNEMEQMALRSQMNPHFIFNCLNSIQDYVINSDVEGANKFISDFSRLIRSTLDNSAKTIISIEDEIKYLTNYLIIEQHRFENKFNFNIRSDESINVSENYIPPMILQPYVENAIRHGINNKKDGTGLVQINILKQNNHLICEIIDNGIGRKAAMEFKTNNAIEYQSKGMELTAKRIKLLNKSIGEEIEIKIEDIEFPKTGTKVIVSIPLT